MAALTDKDQAILNLLQDSGREAFLLLDHEGRIMGASPRLARFSGYQPDDLAGKPFSLLAPGELNPEQSLDPPAEGEQILVIRHSSGESMRTSWLVACSGVQSSDGSRLMFAYLQECPVQDEALDSFFLNEAVREMILDDLPVGVLVTDNQGRIVMYNRAQEKITGIGRDKVIGGVLFKDYARQAPPEALKSFMQVLGGGSKSAEHEFDYTDRFGVRRRIKTRIHALTAPEGGIHGVIQTLEDISRPRRLEQEINQTKDLLRRLLDSTPNAVITTDTNGVINFANRAAENLLGPRNTVADNLRLAQLYKGGAREAREVKRILDESLEGTVENYETYFKDFEGREVPVSLTESLIYDYQHHILGTIAIIRDLSREKKLESEHRRNERYLATVIHDSVEAIISLDETGLIKTWNRGAENIFGYTSEEMVGRTLERLMLPDPSNHGKKQWIDLQLAEHGELRNYVTESIDAEDRRLVVEATYTMLRDLKGTPCGSSIIFHDITERARLERSLQQHISDMSLINEVSETLLSTTDLNDVLGIILVAVTSSQGLAFNRAFMLLADEQENALVGKLAIGPSNPDEAGVIWNDLYHKPLSLRELMTSYNSYALEHDIHVNDVVRSIRIPLSEEDNPLIRCFNEKQPRNIRNGVSEGRLPGWLAELLGTDTLAIAPMVCKHRCVGLLLADNLINRKPIGEDSIRLLMVFANLASQAIEQSRLYMSLEEKITSLDNAYRQLKESRDLLVRSEKLSAVGEVAANVAHEIRNPLVSIGGFARSLAEDQKTDKASRKKLRIIVEEVERLERYLQHTLAFIRPNLPAFQPSDPYRLVMETFQMMDAEIRDSQVRIDIEQLDEPPALELDAEQIRQVLLNIFRNAIEAMPDGGCLNVTFTRDQDYFTFNIADTGVGIDKSIVENLFTAFFTTKSTGSGLGLAISSQIIQNHGGTIGISIPEEAGAVFHITLPIRQSVKDREDL